LQPPNKLTDHSKLPSQPSN